MTGSPLTLSNVIEDSTNQLMDLAVNVKNEIYFIMDVLDK